MRMLGYEEEIIPQVPQVAREPAERQNQERTEGEIITGNVRDTDEGHKIESGEGQAVVNIEEKQTDRIEEQIVPQPELTTSGQGDRQWSGDGSLIDSTEKLTEEKSDDPEAVELAEQTDDGSEPVDTPVLLETVPQLAQSTAQTQPPASRPVQPSSQTQTPQTQTTPPPVQPQTPPPSVQTPPPVAQPESRQPAVVPPTIGPAEERLPSQRESAVPSQRESVVPSQRESTVTPQRESVSPVRESAVPPQRGSTVPRTEPPASVVPAVSNPASTSQNDGVAFSRTVRATVGQIIEIPFTGTGWIYMGELASRRGIVYSSTRRDPDGQSIIFGAEAAGTYVLKFFKENFLSGFISNDYVQVIVGEAPSTGGTGWFAPPYDRGRVVALPRWPSALDAQQRNNEQGSSFPAESGTAPAGNAAGASSSQQASSSQGTSSQGTNSQQGTASQSTASSQGTASQGTTTPSQQTRPQGTASSQGAAAANTAQRAAETAAAQTQDRVEPSALLQRAGETFTAGNVADALTLLDQYKEYYPNGTDELYWLYGQFYEANSPSRNILLSLDYYRRLVREYPQSSRYNDARRRIAYLERFYINIQ